MTEYYKERLCKLPHYEVIVVAGIPTTRSCGWPARRTPT
jgi:hypothetical protein